MTQNPNNNVMGLLFWTAVVILFYFCYLIGAAKRNNIQQSPIIMGAPQQNNGTNFNDILREQIRQSGATTRQVLQPQQFQTFDPSKVQGITPPMQQQPQIQQPTNCVYSTDINGNIIQRCNP